MTKANTPGYVVARFVIRKDDAATMPMIGKVIRPDALKPDHIYQIEEWVGELVIRDLGPSAIASEPLWAGAPTWGYDFNWIFQHYKEFIMTKVEYLKAFQTPETKDSE